MFSFSNYNNAEAAVIKLLKRLSINADPAKVIAELGKHPDYPSLLAISDVLSNFDIDNNALIIYLNIFFMKNVNKLSRAEMKNVLGGVAAGGCEIAVSKYVNGVKTFQYWSTPSYSVSDAQSAYSNGAMYSDGSFASGYCCASCNS